MYIILIFALFFGSRRARKSGPILTIYTSYDVTPPKDVPFGDLVYTAPHFAAILKNWKIAISQPGFVRFRQSLASRRSSTISSVPTVKNLNGYVAGDLGWPLSTSNYLNFYNLHCLMHLRNWRCKGWLCYHSLRTTNCDPLHNFWGNNHITGTSGPNVKFCTQLWSRDCFNILPLVAMQRVARVCLDRRYYG